MGPAVLRGVPASPGEAIGPAWRRPDPRSGEREAPVDEAAREQERDIALAALSAAAEALEQLASRLPAEEAEIVRTGALMALDPALSGGIEEAVMERGLAAAAAIVEVTGEHADAIAGLGDATLAARADDVRSLGRRAAGLVAGGQTPAAAHAPAESDLILVADDLGPADVAELAPCLAGVALAGGGATAHAAIVARSLGIPMVTGVEREVLQIADGTTLALDGSTGLVILDPDAEASALAAQRMQARRLAREQERAQSGTPALTTDGKRITVLANVATAAELAVALGAGAEGIGLLRTELAFLDAPCWPDEQSYTNALAPILDGLEGRPALVRVLDFGADKSPPFLRGTDARGLALLLSHPEEFIRQLRAILHCGAGRDVRIFLPMVDQPEQVEEARALLRRAARELGVERIPALGSMVETPLSAANADAIAGVSDFLSIGTNDLTATTLGLDRFATGEARAHDPHVLRLIAKTVQAARRAGIPIEVCGESASDPVMLPLLIGLGVDQISVGAAQVGPVRRWIRCIRAEIAVTLAQSTLVMDSAEEVERAVGPLASELTAPEPRTLADEPTQVGV